MKVKFVGPDNQVNYDFGIESGDSTPEPGETYTVSDTLGQRLVSSSQMWVEVKSNAKPLNRGRR